MAIVLVLLAAGLLWSLIALVQIQRKRTDLQSKNAEAQGRLTASQERITSLSAEVATLRAYLEKARPYLDIADAKDEAERIRSEAREQFRTLRAEVDADVLDQRRESQAQAKERVEKAELRLEEAGIQARAMIDAAQRRAEEIAGDAYKALKNADHIKRVVDAMRNKIEGYGNRYLAPTYSMLDELADAYGAADSNRRFAVVALGQLVTNDSLRLSRKTCQYGRRYRSTDESEPPLAAG